MADVQHRTATTRAVPKRTAIRLNAGPVVISKAISKPSHQSFLSGAETVNIFNDLNGVRVREITLADSWSAVRRDFRRAMKKMPIGG